MTGKNIINYFASLNMKTYRYFILLFIIAAQISSVSSQSILSLDSKIKNKIDPLLQQAVIQKELFPGRPMATVESYTAGARLSAAKGDAVAVLIQSPNDIQIREYIKSIGGTVGSQHGSIYTALIPVQSVAQLAQQTTVSYIEASRKLFPSLDLSRPKTGADVLQSYPDTTKRLTGKGVIIGFTDTGINTDHPNFKLPDGRTRILYVWDQYGSGTPPAGFSYGVEKDSSAINAHTWSMSDDYEHGTHTSGIAAGNGKPSMQYIGMAPEADIIMVANQGEDLFNRGLTTVGTLDGYDYIRTKANALHKRFVINTSQGTNLGPHDGTTLFEQAVNADVAAGNINCISAGNEATSSRHASAVITTSTPQVIQCSLTDGSGTSVPMDIWYETNDRLELRIKESSAASYLSFFPPVDSTITYSLSSVDLIVTTKIGSPLNGDNEIYIVFQEKSSSCNLQLQFSAQTGNTLPDGGRVDLWWERNYYVSFTDHVDQSITLGMPACADSAITVASYNNRSGYGSVDDISTFSAHGPRRDGAMKPDIAGIGGMVISSVGSGSYATFSGTSMSSPHVAGAVALLLQQDTTLKSYQIKQKLFATATADGFTGPVPNPTWGYGKLNVLKAAGLHGIPIINISKDTVYFTNAFIAIKSDDSVTIKNLGSEDLTISNVSVSDPIFSVDRTSFVIPPRSQDRLIISVTPVSVGSFSGSITITSNDSINPISRINVLGYGDNPPIITVVPDSFNITLLEGDSTIRTLTIGNIGEGRLLWNISYNSIVQNVPLGVVLKQVEASRREASVIVLSNSEANGIDKASYKSLSNNLTLQGKDAGKIDQAVGSPAPGFINAISSGGVIEDFETGIWPWSPWVSIGGGGTIVSDAYQGTRAILNPGWYYRTDVTIGSPGDKLSMWVKPGDGRFYLGFGATSLGAWSLVAGVNTNTFILQQNTGYLYSDLASVTQSWVSGSWYKLEVTFSDGGLVVGRLYGSDGTTLLNTVSATLTGFVPAGVAIRGFGSNSGFTGDYLTQDLSEKWLSAVPSNGIVTPNGSQDVTVKFNARGVKGGDYRSNIVINNNSPLLNPKFVPTSLHVIGKPIIHVAPDTLKYGISFIGITRVDTIVIDNIGSDVLQVNNVSVSDTAFHPNMTSFSVPSDGRTNLLLTYVPASGGPFTAIVSISSNDSSALLKTIPIIGEAAYPPVITVAPDSFMVTLASGDSVNQTMTIGNSGAGSLTWNIYSINKSSLFYKMTSLSARTEKVMQSITSEGSKTIPGTDVVVRSIIPIPQRLKLGQLNSAINGVGKVLIIGDGSTEYSIDSLLAKEGISSTIVTSDGVYDGTNPSLGGYSTVILCDGYSGWSTGMPDGGQTAIVDFVNGGGNLIVMEWVAFEIYSGRYTILAPYIPVLRSAGASGTEIYSVVAKGPITQDVDSTFSVTTATNVGTARFGTVLVKGTICGDAVVVHDVGEGRIVQFACAGNYNSLHPFLERNMSRLLLNSLFHSSLVSVTPSSGTITAGSFQYVDVKFNAKNLIGGDYREIISIKSNDPVHNPKNVPANMHVIGKPALTVVPDTVKAGAVFVGLTHIDTLKVNNVGSDVLNVTNVTSSMPVFTPSITNFSVSPGGKQIITVTFTPSDSIVYNGVLTIASNDSLHPAFNVVLKGQGLYPPVMTVTPDSLAVVLNVKDSTTKVLTISNTGESVLNWNSSVHYVSGSSYQLSHQEVCNYKVGRLTSDQNNLNRTVGVAKSTSAQAPTLNGTKLSTGPVIMAGTYSGDYLNFGITDYGEIMPFQYPIGTEHLQVGWYGSGYTVAYIVNGNDNIKYAGQGSRLGITPVLYRELVNNAVQVIIEITTQTDDSNLRIVREMTFNKHDKYINIKTGLYNISGNVLQNVVFKEWADWDVDGVIYNDWNYDVSRNMAYAFKVHYTAIGGQIAPALMDIDGWSDYSQRATVVNYTGGVTNFDGLEILHYELGNLSASASTSITNAYAAGDNLVELQGVMDRVFSFSGWLSLDRTSGTIPPHSSIDINVKFNSTGLNAGDYSAFVRISGNDPMHASKDIPAKMHINGGTDVADNMTAIPTVYAMRQNYPNPFNPSTIIQYDLPKSSHVTISIYNILGKLVTTLVDEDRPAGTHSVQWNCQTNYGTAASGIYFAVIHAGDFRKTVKMVLMK